MFQFIRKYFFISKLKYTYNPDFNLVVMELLDGSKGIFSVSKKDGVPHNLNHDLKYKLKKCGFYPIEVSVSENGLKERFMLELYKETDMTLRICRFEKSRKSVVPFIGVGYGRNKCKIYNYDLTNDVLTFDDNFEVYHGLVSVKFDYL